MSVIVLDVELADNNVVEELGVFIDGQVFGYSLKPPSIFQPKFQTLCCRNKIDKIDWRSGALDYNDVTKILTSPQQYRAKFVANGLKMHNVERVIGQAGRKHERIWMTKDSRTQL